MPIRRILPIVLSIVLMAILGTAAAGFAAMSDNQTTMQDVKKEMQDLTETLKGYTIEQRDAAMEKSKQALDFLDQRIDVLQNRMDDNWDRMSRSARENARRTMRELREQRLKAAEWYGSLKASSAAAWDHMKKGFVDAYDSLGKAWEKSEKEFESNNK